MGKCQKIQCNEEIKEAKDARDFAYKITEQALNEKKNRGFLNKKEKVKFEKIRNRGANIGALIINDQHKYVACSSINSMDYIYNDYFVTNSPDISEVAHVTSNRDINLIGRGMTRERDTEVKLLKHLVLTHPDLLKEEIDIYMYTYRQPCLSCDYYIINFLKDYTGVNLYIYYEVEYPEHKVYHNLN